MKNFFNHIYNGPHGPILNVALFIGGISVYALVSGFFGSISFIAKAIYDIRQVQKQKKQALKDEEEEKIKTNLYNEYLKNQNNEKNH